MKTLALLAGLILLLALGLALYIRFAPSDPARWHGDPESIPDPRTPNFARLVLDIALPGDTVHGRITAQARREGAVPLAGDPALMTWVARTRLMKFPDYVTIRLDETAQGTRVTALSRSRFGHGDHGVNAARLQRWIGRMVP
ncbi:MAG: DUF1499 domain-containing protein [Pararhodobacter sp.]|nr:DUF1499 domain-containing protein [Pararhodobacter sp.]